MIEYIKGELVIIGLDYIVIENSGIGYHINYINNSKLMLNESYQIFTYQHIREDENTLYGFLSIDEREFFKRLISVKGLGPKTAMNIFSAITLEQLINAIENNDVALLKKLPKIGAKTASQIVLDLKGKLVVIDNIKSVSNNNINDALEALKSLGYKASELNNVSNIFKENGDLQVDELIKIGLVNLNKARR